MVKKMVKKIIAVTKPSGFASAVAPAVTILRYHSVKENAEDYAYYFGGISMPSSVFEDQMRILRDEYNPVDMDQVHDFIRHGEPLPRRAVAVTFDDGFADNLHVATPILNEYGVRATIYISTRPVDTGEPFWFLRLRYAFHETRVARWQDPFTNKVYRLDDADERRAAFIRSITICAGAERVDHHQFVGDLEAQLEVETLNCSESRSLTEEEIRQLDQQGQVVGAHTVDHLNISQLPPDTQAHQLIRSKKRLETILGKPVPHFSYPKPYISKHYDESSRSILEAEGVRTAVTCDNGPARCFNDVLALPRVFARTNELAFRWAMEKSFLASLLNR